MVVPFAQSPLAGPTYPFFPVICDSCGHTRFFNALTMGVLEGADDEGKGVTISEPEAEQQK